MRTRRRLYRAASILGDVEAIASGSPRKMARRAVRKVATRKTMGLLGRLFR